MGLHKFHTTGCLAGIENYGIIAVSNPAKHVHSAVVGTMF